ncbi:Hypothetical predicted protein [Olea europaea subsp. europaea]|uniref:Uncharacterized protein n=1 Tax=Olea europaea subsp. europaea TaxID=158383 RepID=A0A8S0R8Y4_OLEEU|nr:Hypothetical predicted protein [Olea europaea subsp. europaea]
MPSTTNPQISQISSISSIEPRPSHHQVPQQPTSHTHHRRLLAYETKQVTILYTAPNLLPFGLVDYYKGALKDGKGTPPTTFKHDAGTAGDNLGLLNNFHHQAVAIDNLDSSILFADENKPFGSHRWKKGTQLLGQLNLVRLIILPIKFLLPRMRIGFLVFQPHLNVPCENTLVRFLWSPQTYRFGHRLYIFVLYSPIRASYFVILGLAFPAR